MTKVWTKPQTQAAIKALRNIGLTVEKINSGYVCRAKNKVTGEEKEVFKAMVGSAGYLVRYEDSLFLKTA